MVLLSLEQLFVVVRGFHTVGGIIFSLRSDKVLIAGVIDFLGTLTCFFTGRHWCRLVFMMMVSMWLFQDNIFLSIGSRYMLFACLAALIAFALV